MAFNVSQITAFTDETSQALITKAVLKGRTLDYVTVVPGIKGTQALNIMDNTITISAEACGWNPAGNVAFTQRDITVTALKVNDALCPATLEAYWVGQKMKAGYADDAQLGPVLANSYVEKVQVANESNYWLGVKGSTAVGVPNKIDGFLEVLSGEAYVGVTASAGPFTVSTIKDKVDLMINAAPEVLSTFSDLTMFMSIGDFRLYTQAIAEKNYFAVPANVGTALEFVNPINGVRFVGIAGLAGSSKLILTYASNLVVGTDLDNEEEKFDIWYSMDNQEVRVAMHYKIGTQVQFPELVVINQA